MNYKGFIIHIIQVNYAAYAYKHNSSRAYVYVKLLGSVKVELGYNVRTRT